MTITLATPDGDQLDEVVQTLATWQSDDLPLQLHPGDLGWFSRNGVSALAGSLRLWTQDGELAALGMLDGADILRLTVAPQAWRDDELARQIVADVSDPARGLLGSGTVAIETPDGTAVRETLDDAGWSVGEAWTPLRLDLADPVERPELTVEEVGPEQAEEFTAVVRSAFGSPRFTVERWQAMVDGPARDDLRCLLARYDDGAAVAAITVWSAGAGRPGLIEPLGVHVDHRGHGYGPAMCRAGAIALRELGASSVLVCTPSTLTGAVATYRSAGFEPLPERFDRTRTS